MAGATAAQSSATPKWNRGTVGVCHCSDCQQLTGSPFRANIQAPAAGFRMLQGDPGRYVKHGDSGAARVHAFCGDCGSPVFSCAPENPQSYTLRLGALRQRYNSAFPHTDLDEAPFVVGYAPCRSRRGGRSASMTSFAQCAVKPPSTGRPTPMTKLAPGLHSHNTAAATSSALPRWPNNIRLLHDFGHRIGLAGQHVCNHGRASEVVVAIEVPHGPVVDTLLDRGFAVYSINPKSSTAYATGSV